MNDSLFDIDEIAPKADAFKTKEAYEFKYDQGPDAPQRYRQVTGWVVGKERMDNQTQREWDIQCGLSVREYEECDALELVQPAHIASSGLLNVDRIVSFRTMSKEEVEEMVQKEGHWIDQHTVRDEVERWELYRKMPKEERDAVATSVPWWLRALDFRQSMQLPIPLLPSKWPKCQHPHPIGTATPTPYCVKCQTELPIEYAIHLDI